VVKGGDLDRLLAKLRDIDLAYSLAKAQQATPAQAATWAQLDARHAEDLHWYAAEFLDRHDFDQVQADLRQRGPLVEPRLGLVLHLVRARSKLKADQARVVRSWQHERNRADRLDLRLADLRKLLER
jgi:multidrug resistance efflux pump